MAYLRLTEKYILIILFQLSIVITNESTKFCNSEIYCNNCIFCEIKTKNNNDQCSFDNLFCKKDDSNELFFNEVILPQYNSFFQNNINNPKINDDKEINLNTLKKSFDILKITKKDNENLKNIHFYCLISNSKYLNNKKDTAFLSIEYNLQNNIKKNNSTKNILFYIIFENTKTENSLILSGDDEKIQNIKWKKEINEYDKIIILLEFLNNNIFENDDDSFEIEIETKNKSTIRKKYIIIITVVIITTLILIIVPYIIYTYIKKKKLNEEINKKGEKEMNKKEEMFQKILKNILVQTLSSKDIIIDYPQCAICLQKFISKCSICITPCKHVFHYECLKKLALTKINDSSALKCPLCNYVFWKESLRDSNNIELNSNSVIYNTEHCSM